jgi:hypothetical protein
MSNIHEYDLFICSGGTGLQLAERLSRKLQALDFHVWLDGPKTENLSSFNNRFQKAIEMSAVSMFLFGSGKEILLIEGLVCSETSFRMESQQAPFRSIITALPGISSEAVKTLTDLIEQRLADYPHRLSVIQFKESLDEQDAMHKLILSIRGVAPNDQSDLLQTPFRDALRLRAQNALNIDFSLLASTLLNDKNIKDAEKNIQEIERSTIEEKASLCLDPLTGKLIELFGYAFLMEDLSLGEKDFIEKYQISSFEYKRLKQKLPGHIDECTYCRKVSVWTEELNLSVIERFESFVEERKAIPSTTRLTSYPIYIRAASIFICVLLLSVLGYSKVALAEPENRASVKSEDLARLIPFQIHKCP